MFIYFLPINMEKLSHSSISTVHAAEQVLHHTQGGFFPQRLLPFLGPAFIASIAYVDPGNFATNIQAGSAFGYKLLWVVLASNLMAMLIQGLSAKLGIASGLNLAEHCRLRFPRAATWSLWVIMEVVAMATDLAEFIGAALGFHLLFGIPLLIGGIITAVVTFAILAVERFGFRPIESDHHRLCGYHCGKLSHRDAAWKPAVGAHRPQSCGSGLRRRRRGAARLGHTGRYGNAACHFSSLGAHAGTDHREGSSPAAKAFSLRDRRCGHCHDHRGTGQTWPCSSWRPWRFTTAA